MKLDRLNELDALTPDQMCEEATDAELMHMVRCARIFAEIEAHGVTSIEGDQYVDGSWQVELSRGCHPLDPVKRRSLIETMQVALERAVEVAS